MVGKSFMNVLVKSLKGMREHQLVVTGCLFVLVGLILGYQPFMRILRESQVYAVENFPGFSEAQKQNTPKVKIEGQPARIQLSAVGIDLPVQDGYYYPSINSWTLDYSGAFYAKVTPPPNNVEGNTFIYGHDVPGIFIDLAKLKPGDKAVVTTANGHSFTYAFKAVFTTQPDDTSLFQYSGPPILTLQTCSGTWYQNRGLFTFDLMEVE